MHACLLLPRTINFIELNGLEIVYNLNNTYLHLFGMNALEIRVYYKEL